MKKIEATFPAYKLQNVIDALRTVGLGEADYIAVATKQTCTDARQYRSFGAQHTDEFRDVIRLEAVCADTSISLATEAILTAGCGRHHPASLAVSSLLRVVEF